MLITNIQKNYTTH